jgi:capsular exopolysaccharide synthesis family protein
MTNPENTAPTKSISVTPLLAHDHSILGEQFRKLRTVLKVHHLGNNLRSVLITSLAPSEGKTTVSLNLAAAVARGLDESVVLLDADLRKRGLTSLLGLKNTPGLSEVLEGNAKIKDTFIQTEIKGLNIIPAGINSSSPAELIESQRMKNVLQILATTSKFSYIIIDSPPLIATSEATILSHNADGVILVVMAEKTRRDIVRRELGSLNQTKILGVVLNGAEFETSHYYSKYYRSYYGDKY